MQTPEHIISFKDNGIGISEEVQKHIFDAYYQENTARSNGDIGPRLSICKRIADLRSLKIFVESEKTKATFPS